MMDAHNDVSGERVECDICQRPCSSKKNLETHIKSHVKRLKPVRKPVAEELVRKHPSKYKCAFCPKICSGQTDLSLHLHHHTGCALLKCNFCDFQCDEKSKLNKHSSVHKLQQLSIHNKTKKKTVFKCYHCHFVFKSESKLHSHERENHDMSLRCSICGHRFSDKVALQGHLPGKCMGKRSQLKESTLYDCTMCYSQFNSLGVLRTHLMEHTLIKVSAFYLGANSFGQISSVSSLVCWEPVLFAESLSSVSCDLSTVAWTDAQSRFHLRGFFGGSGNASLTVEIPSAIKFNSITFAFGSICGITDDEMHSFSAHSQWESVKNVALKCLKVAKERIRRVATSGKTVYCLTDNGKIWNLTEEDLSKMQVPIPGTVISFDCGEEHCLAATKDKEVFSWGSSLKGQLGRGTLQEEHSPKRIPALGGLNVIQVSCGKWHNVVLTAEGDLYVWGWNKHGQLGLPCPDFKDLMSIEATVTVQAEPVLLDFQIGVRKIACGSVHTIVLADDYSVWGCGSVKFGQLGKQDFSEKADRLVPVRLPKGKVSDILASDWSSIFIIENK